MAGTVTAHRTLPDFEKTISMSKNIPESFVARVCIRDGEECPFLYPNENSTDAQLQFGCLKDGLNETLDFIKSRVPLDMRGEIDAIDAASHEEAPGFCSGPPAFVEYPR